VDHWSRELSLDVAALKARHADLIAVLPGVEGFLRAVREAGKRLWLVTNAHPASLELKMAETRLGPAFDLMLTSHEIGFPKEDARFWPLFVKRHPFDPGRALMVDDSPPVLAAARAFGIAQVIAITHPDSQQPPKVVEDFAAIEGLRAILP
jgi:putative hydrolase of the HAD superfamily